MTTPLKVWFEAEGRLLRLRLNRPKANIIDAAVIAAFDAALAEHLANCSLAAVLLDAEGPHFSFGASVQEHLKAKSASSLRYALKAARWDYMRRISEKIEVVERLYLDELMRTHDAVEGLQAFIGKRAAQWQHR